MDYIAARSHLRKHVKRALYGQEDSSDPVIAAASRFCAIKFPRKQKAKQHAYNFFPRHESLQRQLGTDYIKERNIALKMNLRRHIKRALEGSEVTTDEVINSARRLCPN
jgi:hypothetical protein